MIQNNPFLSRIARHLATNPLDETFLYAIIDNPEDNASLAIYFDWLAERCDPRGEYVHIQREQSRPETTPEERIRLQQRREELRTHIHPLWLGIVLREPVNGTVTRIDDHGFWVDLGGIEGQVHICDCSWC
jgi:uncharacterized protein (TIGR02996 family)